MLPIEQSSKLSFFSDMQINKHIIVGKDTIIRRLQQQQALRDQLIERQRVLLRGQPSTLISCIFNAHLINMSN